MIVCHVCGTNNPDSAKFCEGCGVELQANTSTAAAAPAPAPAAPAGPLPTVAETIPGDVPVSAVAPAVETASTPAATDASSTPTAAAEAAAPEVPATPAPAAPSPEVASPAAPSAPEASAPDTSPATPRAPAAPAVAAAAVAVPTTPAAGGAPVNPRLVPRQFGALGSTSFPLNGARLSVGRFDPSTGPVDIDLSGLPGDSHVSRRHGELFFENNRWMVRDLGSTNGIYIKRASDSQFGPRLQAPAELQNGDEIAFGNVMFVYQEDASA
jgi:pSer/pThr/pTyr-binding forkhead associated (FHA) protein